MYRNLNFVSLIKICVKKQTPKLWGTLAKLQNFSVLPNLPGLPIGLKIHCGLCISFSYLLQIFGFEHLAQDPEATEQFSKVALSRLKY